MRQEVMDTVDRELGAHRAAWRRCISSPVLPKTRSGKLLRRSLQALAEGRDPGDLTTIEDPAALEQIRVGAGGATLIATAWQRHAMPCWRHADASAPSGLGRRRG